MDGSVLYSILSTLLAALFGGVNIVQLINNRALRRKLEAEADQSQYSAQQVIIDGLREEVARLQQRVIDSDERYDDLNKKYTELLSDMVALKQELATLKTK